MFGRATIRLGIGPHSSYNNSYKKKNHVDTGQRLYLLPSSLNFDYGTYKLTE